MRSVLNRRRREIMGVIVMVLVCRLETGFRSSERLAN